MKFQSGTPNQIGRYRRLNPEPANEITVCCHKATWLGKETNVAFKNKKIR